MALLPRNAPLPSEFLPMSCQRFCPSFCFCPVLCPGLYLIMSQSRGTCNAFLPAFYLFQLFRHSFRVHSIPFRHIPSAFRHIPARFLRKNGLAF
jgi:hypothetical protein